MKEFSVKVILALDHLSSPLRRHSHDRHHEECKDATLHLTQIVR